MSFRTNFVPSSQWFCSCELYFFAQLWGGAKTAPSFPLLNEDRLTSVSIVKVLWQIKIGLQVSYFTSVDKRLSMMRYMTDFSHTIGNPDLEATTDN